MFAAFVLVAVLATPTPLPTAFPEQTPPPEPNHLTIEARQSFLQASQAFWQNWNGVSSQLSGLYEFQASSHLRLADAVHWERLSSHYTTSFRGVTMPWQFNYTEYDDELDVELGRPEYPVGVGIGYYEYNPVYEAREVYGLAGFGAGVDRWPNWYVPRSLYYSAWYYPNVTNSQPDGDAYGILRVDIGLNVRRNLVSPWGFRIGVQNESWFAHNQNAESKNFTGAYASLTWWR